MSFCLLQPVIEVVTDGFAFCKTKGCARAAASFKGTDLSEYRVRQEFVGDKKEFLALKEEEQHLEAHLPVPPPFLWVEITKHPCSPVWLRTSTFCWSIVNIPAANATKGCTATRAEAALTAPKPGQEKQRFVCDAPWLVVPNLTTKSRSRILGVQASGGLQKTSQSVVQSTACGSQSSFKAMPSLLLSRGISAGSRLQPSFFWDHTQQFVWGQIPEAGTCQGFVCLVAGMGKSPFGPGRGYFSAAPGQGSEQLLSGSPWAFLLPASPRSFFGSLQVSPAPQAQGWDLPTFWLATVCLSDLMKTFMGWWSDRCSIFWLHEEVKLLYKEPISTIHS